MFETLFTYPAVLARHQTRPGSAKAVQRCRPAWTESDLQQCLTKVR